MEFTGKYEIAAPPARVWEALNDADVLKACIPGCQTLEKNGPTDFTAAAVVKIGPVKATFKGKVALAELDPPRRCIVRGEGQGGAAGFAKGEAEVLLTQTGSGTTLTYAAKATIGGKLAQIGQRLVDGAARQIADDFFGRFAQQLTEPAAAEPAEAPKLPPRVRPPAKLWIAVGVAVVAILLILLRAWS